MKEIEGIFDIAGTSETNYINDLAIYPYVNPEDGGQQTVALYNFTNGSTNQLEWMSQFDGFGELINLDGNKSLLFYVRNNPVEDFNVNNKDVFGVLIDKSTGEFIGDEFN